MDIYFPLFVCCIILGAGHVIGDCDCDSDITACQMKLPKTWPQPSEMVEYCGHVNEAVYCMEGVKINCPDRDISMVDQMKSVCSASSGDGAGMGGGENQYKVSSVNISKSPQTPHAASSVTLTCASDAYPPATYTWVKVDDENRELSAVMEGTESKLTLTDLNPTTDSGEYKCTASNSYNNNNFSKSQSIHLEILPRVPDKFPVRSQPLSGSSSGETTTKSTGTGCEIDLDEVVITKERHDNDGDDKYIWMGSVIGCSFLISVSIIVFLMWKYRLPKRLPAAWCASVAAPQQPTRLLPPPPVEKTTKPDIPLSDPANNNNTCTCTQHGKNGVLRNSTENGVYMLAKPFSTDTGSEGYFIDKMSSPATSPHTDSHGYLVLTSDTSDPAQMTTEPETPLLGAITYRMLMGKIRATTAPHDEPHIYDEIDII